MDDSYSAIRRVGRASQICTRLARNNLIILVDSADSSFDSGLSRRCHQGSLAPVRAVMRMEPRVKPDRGSWVDFRGLIEGSGLKARSWLEAFGLWGISGSGLRATKKQRRSFQGATEERTQHLKTSWVAGRGRASRKTAKVVQK